jgi:hypothetical protein
LKAEGTSISQIAKFRADGAMGLWRGVRVRFRTSVDEIAWPCASSGGVPFALIRQKATETTDVENELRLEGEE